MKTESIYDANNVDSNTGSKWLVAYYLTRAAVSFGWVGVAIKIGAAVPIVAAVLLIFYPAWDAAANFLDAHRNGGSKRNPSQMINAILSLIATIAIALALVTTMNTVLCVFGIWAIISGLLQLATAVRRWNVFGAQWVMVLSGAQSALAGGFFVVQSSAATPHSIVDIVPYVAFGACYFLVSGIWLAVQNARRRQSV